MAAASVLAKVTRDTLMMKADEKYPQYGFAKHKGYGTKFHLEQLNLLVSKGGKWSMPSNHAANMFSLAVILSHFYSKYRGFLFFFAVTISFSRVYVGVHFPGDLIVGALIGYAISLLCLSLWGNIKLHEIRKGKEWVHF